VENGFQVNGPHIQAGVAILISDQEHVRLNSIRGYNEGHFILMKWTIHQEDLSVLNIYTASKGVNSYIKKNSNGSKSIDRN
jgi:hypothetical protein